MKQRHSQEQPRRPSHLDSDAPQVIEMELLADFIYGNGEADVEHTAAESFFR